MKRKGRRTAMEASTVVMLPARSYTAISAILFAIRLESRWQSTRRVETLFCRRRQSFDASPGGPMADFGRVERSWCYRSRVPPLPIAISLKLRLEDDQVLLGRSASHILAMADQAIQLLRYHFASLLGSQAFSFRTSSAWCRRRGAELCRLDARLYRAQSGHPPLAILLQEDIRIANRSSKEASC